MDRFSDIPSQIKERFTNPLIFSFVCSWLVINWHVTIALCWYSSSQIEKAGYRSIFEVVEKEVDFRSGFWHPLLIAVIYTLLMPIIKNLIKVFYTIVNKRGEILNLKYLRDGQISITKYLQFRSDYDKRTKALEEVISKETEYIQKWNEEKTELLETKTILNEKVAQITKSDKFIHDLFDNSLLDGRWECIYKIGDSQEERELIVINNLQYYVQTSFGKNLREYTLRDFHFDNRTGALLFVKETRSNDKKDIFLYKINRLKFEGPDRLGGTENATTQISYRRL